MYRAESKHWGNFLYWEMYLFHAATSMPAALVDSGKCTKAIEAEGLFYDWVRGYR